MTTPAKALALDALLLITFLLEVIYGNLRA